MAESSRRASSIVIVAVLIAGVFFLGANLAGDGLRDILDPRMK